LLSIVPIVAMAFGVAKGFGVEQTLHKRLTESVQGQEEVLNRVSEFARSLLENTSGGLIAGIGVAFLFWTVIKMLGNIEKAFNSIWGVSEERAIGRKFTDYLSLMMICPVLIIMSGSVTVFLAQQFDLITAKISLLGFFGPLFHFSLSLFPYVIFWGLLTFIYTFMPNTKVKISSALVGGIIGGTLYQMMQWVYINFQIGVSKYGAIYGSFAALPLFLIWLQISWLIILFGAEIAFAYQNEETYEFESDCDRVSRSFKEILSLRAAQLCFENFDQGKAPLSAAEIAGIMDAPIRLIRQVLHDLTQADVLTEIRGGNDKVRRYHPTHSIEHTTVEDIISALNREGLNELPHVESEELDKIRKCIVDFNNTVSKSPSNVTLKSL